MCWLLVEQCELILISFIDNYRFKTILSQELVFREPSIVEFLVTLLVAVYLIKQL